MTRRFRPGQLQLPVRPASGSSQTLHDQGVNISNQNICSLTNHHLLLFSSHLAWLGLASHRLAPHPTPPLADASRISTLATMTHAYLPGTASLLEELDKRLVVVLRDGRTIIGYLRSVDHFANLVLHRCIERIHVGKDFGDIPRGVFLVRGENVVSDT